jgi:hypothetical protein
MCPMHDAHAQMNQRGDKGMGFLNLLSRTFELFLHNPPFRTSITFGANFTTHAESARCFHHFAHSSISHTRTNSFSLRCLCILHQKHREYPIDHSRIPCRESRSANSFVSP